MSETNPNRFKNRRMKDRKRRKKLRDNLRAQGVAEGIIDEIVDRKRHDDLVSRLGVDRARSARRRSAERTLDDTGYEPTAGDPLLRGAARATGMTAKVVKRRETITDWQYDRLINREAKDA